VAVSARVPPWVFATRAARAEQDALDPRAASRAPPPPALAALMKAQYGEDAHLHARFFAGKRGGLILESGALDGAQYSTTAFWVYGMGWRAVHVEASPVSFAALAANRPESLNIHSALCARAGALHYAADGAVAGGKHAVDGLWELMSENHKRAYFAGAEVSTMPTVACRPISALLNMFGIAHVDVWVLDVEGGELEVLETMDFAAVEVDVIVVEADGGNAAKDAAVSALLRKRGFVFAFRNVANDYWARRGFNGTQEEPPPPPLQPRALRGALAA